MSIMVTGGYGLVGSAAVRLLAQKGEEVVIYDIMAREAEFLRGVDKARVKSVIGDTLDLPRLIDMMRDHQVEVVVHTAAPVSTDIAARGRPYQTIRENIETVLNCAEAARLANVRRFIHVSTGAVYGGGSEPATEDTPLSPAGGAYGVSKAAGDMIVGLYGTQYGHLTQYVAARIVFIYGPGRAEEATYVGPMVAKAIHTQEIVLQKGGDYRAEFTHSYDVARGLYLVAKAPRLEHAVYNIGTGRQYTLREVAEEVARQVAGTRVDVGPGLPEGRTIRRPLDIRRIAEELAYRPEYDLRAGVASVKRWLTEGEF